MIIKPKNQEVNNDNIELIANVIHTKTLDNNKVKVLVGKSGKINIIFDLNIVLDKEFNRRVITYFNGFEPLYIETDDEVFY